VLQDTPAISERHRAECMMLLPMRAGAAKKRHSRIRSRNGNLTLRNRERVVNIYRGCHSTFEQATQWLRQPVVPMSPPNIKLKDFGR